MLNDKTTLKDLSVFTSDAGGGVFGLLKHCTTQVGQEALCKHILNPPDNLPLLQALQNTVRFWTRHTGEWPDIISNGTVVMLENFFEASDHEPPQSGLSAVLGNFLHKLLNRQQYEYAQFSVSHISDFLKGCMQLTELLKHPDLPSLLRAELESVQKELQHRSSTGRHEAHPYPERREKGA